mgnify:CR=1 FL=1
MSEPIIKVENLSKSYSIGHQNQEQYTALRDVISNGVKGFVKNAGNMIRGKQLMGNDNIEEFFALKDVNFEINQGDRVGIIGRNGAGKSTLLKVLSRITEPTSGRVTINGRVASLLEVGTGFHPELTGRENIFLNGAILGMGRAEIKKKFDEIVDFAEVEKFLDTPVKRYSSGMYVRLAFAVAAHLEPEILIVDEVLAVGDAQFQKKCLGKMEDVSDQGRTILFVSHNMSVMKSLCLEGILLTNGNISFQGSIEECVNLYQNDIVNNKFGRVYNHIKGNDLFNIIDVTICGRKNPVIHVNKDLTFTIGFESKCTKYDIELFILVYNYDGVCILGMFQRDSGSTTHISKKVDKVDISIKNKLAPGKYVISVGAFDKYKNFIDWVEFCESFVIDNIDVNGKVYEPRLGIIYANQI